MKLLELLWLAFWSFAAVFLICELGHRMSETFTEIDSTIGELNWYLFPIEMWYMLPILIAVAQQPVRFGVFGSISCSRVDFKKVDCLEK